MPNKYGSNTRTVIARNLIWNSGASPVDLYAVDAPNDIALNFNGFSTDGVFQPFRANWPLGVSWNISANINLRRFGVFSNFADGLVLSNTINRLVLNIYAVKITLVPVAGSVAFTEGSNLVTGTNLDSAFPFPPGYIADGSSIYTSNYYGVEAVSAGGTGARLSDYAYRTVNNAAIYRVAYALGHISEYVHAIIPALNFMYEAESLFDTTILRTSITENVLLIAKLSCLPATGAFNLFTTSIDTGFNGKKVSFDAVLEVESTPYVTSLTPVVFDLSIFRSDNVAVTENVQQQIPLPPSPDEAVTVTEDVTVSIA